MQLRDYQQEQLKFLNQKAFKGENIFLESPTGSGKTAVMVEYIKKHPKDKFTISTGFNELVFQIADTLKSEGVSAAILIGKGNVACLRNGAGADDEPFTPGRKHTCGDTIKCGKCKYSKNCLYWKAVDKANEAQVIVTNHSSLCIGLVDTSNSDMALRNIFIDECHTFGSFYESFLSLDISGYTITSFLEILENYLPGEIQTNALRYAISNGCVNSKVLYSALNLFYDQMSLKMIPEREANTIKSLQHSIEGRSFDNVSDIPAGTFSSPQISEGKFIGVHMAKFFDRVPIRNSVLLSATVDNYTKNIFNARTGYTEKSHLYDYSKSTFRVYDTAFNIDDLREFIMEQTAEHGLFLFTQLLLVEEYKKLGELCGYEIITRRNKFVDGKKQILVGSRKLFQGVDIKGIGFIVLNKIPFDRYDELYKARMSYLESKGHRSYTFYTIPFVENQLQQQIGRLWRHPGDNGEIALFDERAKGKHIGIVENVLKKRPGIKNNLYTL